MPTPSVNKETAREIALEFAERFQNNYPKQPLWEMMDDLRIRIDEYAKSIASLTWDAAENYRYYDSSNKETYLTNLFEK